MPKVMYDNLTFDSELEVEYYKCLKEDGINFLYQNEYRKTPIHINLGRRKTYVPDFIVFDDWTKTIVITELKGYAKWSANEDNNIMDFMRNKVATDVGFLAEWLAECNIDTRGWDISYKRLKLIKSIGFVDYDYKNPNSIANKRKEKISVLTTDIKQLEAFKKNVDRYYSYIRKMRKKEKLTKSQKEWIYNYEKENDLL